MNCLLINWAYIYAPTFKNNFFFHKMISLLPNHTQIQTYYTKWNNPQGQLNFTLLLIYKKQIFFGTCSLSQSSSHMVSNRFIEIFFSENNYIFFLKNKFWLFFY